MILCPHCLNEIEPKKEYKGSAEVYVCPREDCKRELPRIYVEGKMPKTIVGLVGFTGHGKTVYLTSLFYLLKKLREIYPEYYFLCADEYALEVIYKHVKEFEQNSELPKSTSENFPEPALLEFRSIPLFGEWFLIFFDTGGRVFREPGKISDTARYVAKSEVVLFIISISDCIRDRGEQWRDEMMNLLETYYKGVYDRMHIDLKKRQKLIVVLTKGDELKKEGKFVRISQELADYLDEGSYEKYLELKKEECIRKLEDTSKLIRGWLSKNGCVGFINIAEDNFKSVRYSIVSSTGAAPVDKMLATRLKMEDPKRVLDPFLWVLVENQPRRLKKWIWIFVLGILILLVLKWIFGGG